LVKYGIKTGFEQANVLADSSFICDTFVSEIQKINIGHVKNLRVSALTKTNIFIIINGKNKMPNLVSDHKRKDIRFSIKAQM
jgi:hypothetical protein